MLIDELFDGRVDVVGDVHGEIHVLEALLTRLGYDDKGRHPQGRRLVFVGDLTDRGPDSLAVVRLVRGLLKNGRAQCVMGNHELNILRREEKDGNAWFFGKRDHHEDGTPTSEVQADDRGRDEVAAFFGELPLALEREDLRVVHACWHDGHVAALRGKGGCVVTLGNEIARDIAERLVADGTTAGAGAEEGALMTERDRAPAAQVYLPAKNVREQNEHPMKVLTSGTEAVCTEPFWAGGKWRFETRVRWWESYNGPMTVVGHYWRSKTGEHLGKGVNLFEGTEPQAPLGPEQSVMVVDYSIGHRAQERHGGGPTRTALAAYRWPEGRLVFQG